MAAIEVMNIDISNITPAMSLQSDSMFSNLCIVTSVRGKKSDWVAVQIYDVDEVEEYYDTETASGKEILDMVDTAFANGSNFVTLCYAEGTTTYFYCGEGTDNKVTLYKNGNSYYKTYSGGSYSDEYTETTRYYYLDTGEKKVTLFPKTTSEEVEGQTVSVTRYYTDEACTQANLYEGDDSTVLTEAAVNTAVEYKTIETSLEEAAQYFYYAVTVTSDVDVSAYSEICRFADDMRKLFIINFIDSGSGASAKLEAINALEDKDRIALFYTKNENNTAFAVEAACNAMGGAPGNETWAYRVLTRTAADKYTNIAEYVGEEGLNYNLVSMVGGNTLTFGGKTLTGEWIDVVRFRDWLENRLQISLFSLLAEYDKVPYTEEGISLVESTINSVLNDAKEAGGVTSFFVEMPAMAGLDEYRPQRLLPNVGFGIQLAGAIHFVTIYGTINI